MIEVRSIIKSIDEAEQKAFDTTFVAPVVENGRVRVRIAGLISILRPEPAEFSGWGIFQARQDGSAALIEPANPASIYAYCRLLPALRVRLTHRLRGSTWLAYPTNESDAANRFSCARPLLVRLVSGANTFDVAVVRVEGGGAWFERLDRRANPRAADMLRDHLKGATEPADLRFRGLTQEMRAAYELAAGSEADRFVQLRRERDTARLQEALVLAGGALLDYADRGEFWQVQWTTSNGVGHLSAIAKSDLTVVSSGVCLSGRDSDFDLQSLVGVIERRGEDWF